MLLVSALMLREAGGRHLGWGGGAGMQQGFQLNTLKP